jgi:DNA-binding NtrC family response regulator
VVRLGLLDVLGQIALFENNLSRCSELLDSWQEVNERHNCPARSWYDLDHQLTRCAYHERLGDWTTIVGICDEVDSEVARRQYKAIRTSLLSAKARALARLGETTRASQAVAGAVRACPRGAIDPQIVLEATKGTCTALAGDRGAAATHFDRALAACRAIGHKYHEAWITRERQQLIEAHRSVVVPQPNLDTPQAALLLTDIAAALGAGHSIDLLTQHTLAMLRSTPLGARVETDDESGCEFQPEPSATAATAADGTFTLQLRGSDRRTTIRVRGIRTIDEISLIASLADVVRAAVNRTIDTENEDDDQTLWPRAGVPQDDDVVFRSPRMVEILKIVARLASAPLPILITGETGTGKEIIARMLHHLSDVRKGPFVPFNCAATPRDLVESQLFGHRRGAFTGATESFQGLVRAAENGTLFLDEIGELDPAIQPKLLRFLESGEVHTLGEPRSQRVGVRVVSATNVDVEDMVKQGRFRSDLYYRINGARISLPALRERKDEIPALAAHFLRRFSRECRRNGLRMTDDLVAALLLYDWPGNIRELANEIRRIVALAADGETLSAADLAPHILTAWNERPATVAVSSAPTVQIRLDQSLSSAIDDLEQRFIDHALRASKGRVTDAAEMLGLSRKGLFLKRRRRGMVPRDMPANR